MFKLEEDQAVEVALLTGRLRAAESIIEFYEEVAKRTEALIVKILPDPSRDTVPMQTFSHLLAAYTTQVEHVYEKLAEFGKEAQKERNAAIEVRNPEWTPMDYKIRIVHYDNAKDGEAPGVFIHSLVPEVVSADDDPAKIVQDIVDSLPEYKRR